MALEFSADCVPQSVEVDAGVALFQTRHIGDVPEFALLLARHAAKHTGLPSFDHVTAAVQSHRAYFAAIDKAKAYHIQDYCEQPSPPGRRVK